MLNRHVLFAFHWFILAFVCQATDHPPRVFVTTDIGINDPDDDQSVCHLLHYATDIELVGLVPDLIALHGREDARKRLQNVLDAYEADYNHPAYHFQSLKYPTPDEIRDRILWTKQDAVAALIEAASENDHRPLYVLVWGKMQILTAAVQQDPSILDHIRLFSIGTNLKANDGRKEHGDGLQRNWNWMAGRDDLLRINPNLWWIESDWTYNGMFPSQFDDPKLHGDPVALREHVKKFGALGFHIWEMGNFKPWSGYFRCGDTPSLNYVLDEADDDDPSQAGWAGRYIAPLPEYPNYFTGIDGGHKWDYREPTKTWPQAQNVLAARVRTLLEKRPEMYNDYRRKLVQLYGEPND